MNIFGIGPGEIFFIVLLALIIMGPKDMVKTGYQIGRFLRRTIFSPTWLDIQRKVRQLPNQLMREVGLEEKDLKIDAKKLGLDTQIDLGLDDQGRPRTIARPSTPLTPALTGTSPEPPTEPAVTIPTPQTDDTSQPYSQQSGPAGEAALYVSEAPDSELEAEPSEPEPLFIVDPEAPAEWITPPPVDGIPDQLDQDSSLEEIPGEWTFSSTPTQTLEEHINSPLATSEEATGED